MLTEDHIVICSLSPLVLVMSQADAVADRLKQMAGDTAKAIISNDDARTSLQAAMPVNGRLMRQMDIRERADGPVIFKTFTGWVADRNCWHVCIELACEDHFEKHIANHEAN